MNEETPPPDQEHTVRLDLDPDAPTITPTAFGEHARPRGAASRSAFEAGHVVAGRYRIVRFIARGGMGEVYEAEDLELHGSVALKTIRPEVAEDAVAVERFRREIQIARKVTHPSAAAISGRRVRSCSRPTHWPRRAANRPRSSRSRCRKQSSRPRRENRRSPSAN